MMWRFIYYFYPSPYRDANEKRESCLKQTESAFPPVITSMYIKSKGIDKSQHAMDQVTMMVQSMQEAFRQNLDFIPWMSRDSAEAAKAKLEHMADLIGYPTFVLNDTWLNQGNFLFITIVWYLKPCWAFTRSRSFPYKTDLEVTSYCKNLQKCCIVFYRVGKTNHHLKCFQDIKCQLRQQST